MKFHLSLLAVVAAPSLRADGFSFCKVNLSRETVARSGQGPLFVSTLTQDVIDNYIPSEAADPNFRLPVTDSKHIKEDQIHQESSASLASFDCATFAEEFPVACNMMIASTKAAVADLFAQTAIAQVAFDGIDWHRTFLFFLFGAIYQGGFQYLYQVNIFSKIFDVEKFTSQPWADKLRDGPGLKSLAVQVALDLTIMSCIYLPTYYTFKSSIFSGVMDPTAWMQDGMSTYGSHFFRDEADLLKIWLPADLVCFSAPLVLRLPLRQVVSLFYTTYLSAATFGLLN